MKTRFDDEAAAIARTTSIGRSPRSGRPSSGQLVGTQIELGAAQQRARGRPPGTRGRNRCTSPSRPPAHVDDRRRRGAGREEQLTRGPTGAACGRRRARRSRRPSRAELNTVPSPSSSAKPPATTHARGGRGRDPRRERDGRGARSRARLLDRGEHVARRRQLRHHDEGSSGARARGPPSTTAAWFASYVAQHRRPAAPRQRRSRPRVSSIAINERSPPLLHGLHRHPSEAATPPAWCSTRADSTTTAMLAIAAELGYSESAFVTPARRRRRTTSASSARRPRWRSAAMRRSPPASRSPSASGAGRSGLPDARGRRARRHQRARRRRDRDADERRALRGGRAARAARRRAARRWTGTPAEDSTRASRRGRPTPASAT